MYDVVTLYALLACMSHATASAFDSQMLHASVLLVGVTAGEVVACRTIEVIFTPR